jgi:hypothetical protein
MPTLLELFRTQNIPSGVTAEVVYDVRDSKRIPVTSINPLIQQTGIRVLNFTRNRFSERLSETLLEQELTGVRVLRAASAPVLYGTELVRISTRTTNILDDMKASTGGTGGDGLIGGLINTVERVGTRVLSKLGITFPQLLIPTRVALNDKFKKGLEPNTPVTLAQIKKDGAGSLVGRFLAQNINGTPSQIGRNITSSAISAAKGSVRKLLFGSEKEGGENVAKKNNAIFQIFDSKSPYTSYVTPTKKNDEILARKDLSSLMQQILLGAQAVSRTDLLSLPIKYTQDVSWNDEIELARGDLSSELTLRQEAIDGGTFAGSIYEDRSNLPGSMPVGPGGVKVPTFPSKLRSNKYFWRENGNGSRYTELHKAVVTPGGPSVAEPGIIAAYEQNIAYPFQDFGKAVLPEQLYRNRAFTEGTNLADANSTITSDAYGINNGSDAVNLTRVGKETKSDFVILKLSNIQFRATITGLTETFSPSWDSNKFIGNPFNYYTYSGIERSLSFNFKVFSLSCEEHNNAWEKLEELATKVYPFGRVAFGVKPPIINFTMSNLYKSRTVFIESLTYTTDDNTPWTISDGMTAPQIIDVAISLKFIEVNGAEGNIYDLARDLNCRVMPKTPAQQIIQKAGTEDQKQITDAQPSTDGGGTSTPIATSTGDSGNTPSVNEGSITPNQSSTNIAGGGTPTPTPTTTPNVNIQPIDGGIEEIGDEDTVPLLQASSTTSGVPPQSAISLRPKENRIPINSSGNSIQRSSPINSVSERPQPTPTVAKPKELAPIPTVSPVGGGIQPQLPVETPKPITQSDQNIADSKIDINPNPSIQQIDSDDSFTPIPKSKPTQTPVVQPKKSTTNTVATNSQEKQKMVPPNPTISQPQNVSTSTTQNAAEFSSNSKSQYFKTKVKVDTNTLSTANGGDGIGISPLNANTDDRDKRSNNWKEKNGSDVFRNQGGGNAELGPFIQQIAQQGDITNVTWNEDRSIMYVHYFGGTTVEKSNLRGVVSGGVGSNTIVTANEKFGFVGNTTSEAYDFIQNDAGIKTFYKNREKARKAYRQGLTPDQLAANTNR